MARRLIVIHATLVGVVALGCDPPDTICCRQTQTPTSSLRPTVIDIGDLETSIPEQKTVAPTAQVLFAAPEAALVSWDGAALGATETPSAPLESTSLILPCRKNFPDGNIYRLKITNIPNREGVELHPTLEINQVTPRTFDHIARFAIAVRLTDDDFEQLAAGNFVTKVTYLPDLEFCEAGDDPAATLASTSLAPGVDPIIEADRRGSILAIFRVSPSNQ